MTKELHTKIAELAHKYEKEVIEIRRDFHKHPELRYQEVRTAGIVAEQLKNLGFEVKTGIAETGVVGLLRGKKPGKTVALRADMDALPLTEKTEVEWASVNEGVMHACGHDGHTANLLGVAKILAEMKDDLKGNVKFVFQPAEEGGAGGKLMVEEGVLESPKVDAMFGLHFGPGPRGAIRSKRGVLTAYSAGIELKVHGKKAHTSTPQKGVDAVLILCHIIVAIQSILTREIDPLDVATFSTTPIEGGNATNIVPDLAKTRLGIRCSKESDVDKITNSIQRVAKAIAESMGGKVESVVTKGYPGVENDKAMTDFMMDIAKERYSSNSENLGLEVPKGASPCSLVASVERPLLGGEDFAYFSKKVPSNFFFMSTGAKTSPHTSTYDIDDKVLKISMNIMASIAVEYLNS